MKGLGSMISVNAQSDRQVLLWFQCLLLAASCLPCVNCRLNLECKPLSLYVLYLSRDHFNQLCLTEGQMYSDMMVSSIVPTAVHSNF